MSKSLLVAVNGAAGLLLLAMRDLDSSRRWLVAVALLVNLLLLVGKHALRTRPARLGAWASLAGYAGTVITWLVLRVGRLCGVFAGTRLNHTN